jgi:hypothetical protein
MNAATKANKANTDKVRPEFIQTPNGVWTVTNLKTGGRRTFRLSTWKEKGFRTVAVLTGSENDPTWGDYTNAGRLDEVEVFIPFRTAPVGSELYKAGLWFSKALPAILAGNDIPGCQVLASVKCACCNRALTVPDSILAGLGPVCAGRWKEESSPSPGRAL